MRERKRTNGSICRNCRVRVKRKDVFCPFCEGRVWGAGKILAVSTIFVSLLILTFGIVIFS